jgi:hypothetical protein
MHKGSNNITDETVFPVLSNIPDGISISRPRHDSATAHVITSSDRDHNSAADRIYQFLDSQDLGDYFYRKDIGIK